MKEVKQIWLPRERDEQGFSIWAGSQNSFTIFTSFTRGEEAADTRTFVPGTAPLSDCIAIEGLRTPVEAVGAA